MASKSELKVGDIVRRRHHDSGFAQGSGMVIEIFKWLDTNYGQSQWYLDQLERVIKE